MHLKDQTQEIKQYILKEQGIDGPFLRTTYPNRLLAWRGEKRRGETWKEVDTLILMQYL